MLFQLNHVTKRYGSTVALNDVSLEIKEGESLGIVGKNGAGKTTLFDVTLGLTSPSDGSVEWGFPKSELCRVVGVQMQDGYFEAQLKVREICNLFCFVYRLPFETADKLLKKLDIEHISNRYLTKLSGGERQKVNILLSLLHDPKVLFYDEITTGLDALSREMIYNIILEQKKAGKTVVIVSHYFEEIWEMCDSILILKSGKPVFSGKVSSLGDDYMTFKDEAMQLME